MLHDRRSGAENQDENFKMRKLLENRSNEVSRKVECLDSRGNAHFGSADREIAPVHVLSKGLFCAISWPSHFNFFSWRHGLDTLSCPNR